MLSLQCNDNKNMIAGHDDKTYINNNGNVNNSSVMTVIITVLPQRLVV